MSNEVNKINWELVREMSAQYGHIVPNMRFGEFIKSKRLADPRA